jgi:proteasome accessory factor B
LVYAKKGRSETGEYEVDPYTLVFHKGGIYLLGLAHNRQGMRLFALERIRGVQVTRQRFDIPDSYRPDAHFSTSFGLVNDKPMKVRVRFSPEVAHAVTERIWRQGQQVTTDGEQRVTVEFEASGEMELVSWILSYGMHAEVLDPPELRKEVKRQIREMRQFYRTKDKAKSR